ncbi:MAG: hypothetical protein ACREQ5_02175 [Candidatus Dormibacteria bacterium]
MHQGDLNALASNLTNLYNYGQAGFNSQKPCVIAQQTTGQVIAGTTDTLVNFNAAAINVGTMWVASVPNKITIQVAGVYFVFAQTRWPTIGAATFPANWAQANLLANGTSPSTNTVAMAMTPFTTGGSGSSNQVSTLINLAAGAVLYLDLFGQYTGSATLQTNFGGTFMGAVFQTPSM